MDKHRRQAELYREWNDSIGKKVQRQIDAELSKRRTSDISARRRAESDEYLRILKKKEATGGVYRDIIIESEYDPLMAHSSGIRFKVSDAQDPLKQELLSQVPWCYALMLYM